MKRQDMILFRRSRLHSSNRSGLGFGVYSKKGSKSERLNSDPLQWINLTDLGGLYLWFLVSGMRRILATSAQAMSPFSLDAKLLMIASSWSASSSDAGSFSFQ